jgi:hypothetical protein
MGYVRAEAMGLRGLRPTWAALSEVRGSEGLCST